MKTIRLSQNYETFVDDSDYEFLSQYKWTASIRSKKYGIIAVRGFSYLKDGKSTSLNILMHRVITMCPEGFEVDHIDGNSLNNQKSNLRICTHAQNMRNRRQKTQTSSKYKGVHFCKKNGKWNARLQYNKKIELDEFFENENDAAKRYNDIALKIHGEFACLNRLDG